MLFEKRMHPSQDPDSDFSRALAGGTETAAGVTVTPESAMRTMAWLACVRIIAETAGSLPLITYQRLARGKERAYGHYLYPVLHDVPNPEMTAMTFRETITSHIATRGNGLAEIEFDRAGRVRALWPLNPDKVRLERKNGQLWYVYTLPNSVGGGTVGLPAERVMHVRWLTRNGLWAYSPTDLARETIGVAQAIQEHGARTFSNGAEPGVLLKSPKTLSDTAFERLRETWEERHQGLGKSHRLAILEEGLEIEKLGMTNEDSQFIQSTEMTVAEIARMFSISLDMLAVNGASATYASVEAFGLRFVTFTMRPWFVRWEQEIARSLLTSNERKEYFAEHLVDALLRGDLTSRYTAFVQAVQNGFMTINEVRETENRNPVAGGDKPMVPLNLAPLGAGADKRQVDMEQADKDALDQQQTNLLLQGVIRDAAARIARREAQDVRAILVKNRLNLADAQPHIESFYDAHGEFVRKNLAPILPIWRKLSGQEVADATVHQAILSENRGQMAQILANLGSQEDLDESLAAWIERRADEIAAKFLKFG